MSSENDHEDIRALILENQRLLKENNVLLRKMRTVAIWDFGIRMLITAVFLGLPFVAYFYVLEQYSESINAMIKIFQSFSTGNGLEGMLIRHE